MTVASLHAQFRSLPTYRKRFQLKKIKEDASKTLIGEQGAPAEMGAILRPEMWLVRGNSQNLKQSHGPDERTEEMAVISSRQRLDRDSAE